MSDGAEEFHHDSWMDALKATGQQFEAENDDLEAMLEGDIGFHAFFTDSGQDTRGVQTAIYQALFDCLEELHIDDDVIEHNHGQITPETAAEEVIEQMDYFGGLYVNERLEEAIRERVESRVRKNLRRTEADSA